MRKFRSLFSILTLIILVFTMVFSSYADEPATPPDPNESPIWVADGIVKVYDFDSKTWIVNEELTATLQLEGGINPGLETEFVLGYGIHGLGSVLNISAESADTSFTVSGPIVREVTEEGYVHPEEEPFPGSNIAEAVTIVAGNDFNDNNVDLIIDGDISASASLTGDSPMVDATGFHATSQSTGSSINISITGNVTATAVAVDDNTEDEEWATARSFAVTTGGSGPQNVTVGGNVEAKSEATNGGIATEGVILATGGYGPCEGPKAMTVEGDVTATAVAHSENSYGSVTAVRAQVEDHGEASVTISGNITTVHDGTGEGSFSHGLFLFNRDGTLDAFVGGDIIMTGEVENRGIIINTGEESITNIVVAGSVDASTEAVVLLGDSQIGENVSLTAWELTPNENNVVVVRAVNQNEGVIPEEGEIVRPDYVYPEDEESEKAIHYIIKTAAEIQNSISIETENKEEIIIGETRYHTAHEEESVSLKFDLASDDVLDGIYYNADRADSLITTDKLAKGSDGSWIIKMLRGGGMLLGLKMHKHEFVLAEHLKIPTCQTDGMDLYRCKHCSATKEVTVKAGEGEGHTPGKTEKQNIVDPKPGIPGSYDEVVFCADCGEEISRKTILTEPLPESTTVYELLKILDKSASTEIVFYSDGSYKITYPDKSSESGRFMLKNKELILINNQDEDKTENPIVFNETENLYELDFLPTNEKGKETPVTIRFEFKNSEVEMLKRYC